MELNPCPFCGGEAEITLDTDIFYMAYVARCKACGIAQPYPKYGTEQKAAEAWNRRVSDGGIN